MTRAWVRIPGLGIDEIVVSTVREGKITSEEFFYGSERRPPDPSAVCLPPPAPSPRAGLTSQNLYDC